MEPEITDPEKVADALREIAFYLKIQDPDEHHFRIQSYENAAEAVERVSDPEVLETPEKIDGIGSSISAKIDQYRYQGKIDKLDELRDEVADLREILKVEGVGPKTAKKCYEQLGITTLDELEAAAQNNELQELHRIGAKTEANILEGIESSRAGVQERKPREEVKSYWEGLDARLSVLQDNGTINRYEPAGSFRRREETVGDLDVIVSGDDPSAVFENLENWNLVDKVVMRGDTKMTFVVDDLQVDVRVVPDEEYGACLQYFTGSKAHNTKLRELALSEGYTMNEYGIFEVVGRDDNGDPIKGDRVGGEDEKEMYEIVGVPYQAPMDRDGTNLPSSL